MLEDIRKVYKESADKIKGWESMSKSDLCNKYIEMLDSGNPLAENYMSALICAFWYTAKYFHNRQLFELATEEDSYDWMIEGLLYALEHRVWLDENNPLSKEADGAERAVKCVIYTRMKNFYANAGRQARKANYGAMSLNSLEENSEDGSMMDGYFTQYNDEYDFISDYIYDKIVESFKAKDYVSAFTLDAIMNGDMFDTKEIDGKNVQYFSQRKLKHHLRSIDDNFCKYFAMTYALNENLVKQSAKYFVEATYWELERSVQQLFKKLQRDPMIVGAKGARC